jgi:hypothetical protein
LPPGCAHFKPVLFWDCVEKMTGEQFEIVSAGEHCDGEKSNLAAKMACGIKNYRLKAGRIQCG